MIKESRLYKKTSFYSHALLLISCAGTRNWSGKNNTDPYLISLSPLKYYATDSQCDATLTIKNNSNKVRKTREYGRSYKIKMLVTIKDKNGAVIYKGGHKIQERVNGLGPGEISKSNIRFTGIYSAKKNCPTANLNYSFISFIGS